MGGLSRIQTVWVRDLPVLSQVARLDVVQGAQGSTLVVQDPATGQLARADLGAAFGRAPVPLSSFRLEATGNAGGMVPLRIDGQDRQIEAGTLARLTQAGGTASAYLDGVAFAGNLVVLHHATPGGDAFLFATRPHGSGIDVFRTGSGLPQPVQRVEPVAGFCLSGLSALDSVEIGGRRYLVAASATENGLSSFEIGADPGQVLTPRSAIGVAQGLAIDRPTALVTAVLDGRAHVIAGAFGSGSLNVFELTGEGRLIATDQVNDSLQTRFDGVAALDAVTVGDGVLIAAGGNDGGISLFQLIPGGRLIHRETLVDGTATALDGVRQLRFVQDNGLTELWALSSRDGGLTRLALDTGGLGPVLQGAAAGGDLHGTGAADILIDGPGSDRLFGAAGADVFVFSPDAQADTVADFNRFEDRIDLGAFAGVTGPGDIALGPITGGAVLRWGDETLTLMSHDGARLGWSDLSDAVDFATQRVDLPDPFTLRGDDGDNRFGWAEGPDTIDGGAGFDTMSYADAPQGVVADLGNSRTNGLAALGDVLVGIEAVEGSAFADRLRGDEGENRLSGLGGNDMFVATPGRDWYFGDAGYDTVSYAGA
ncbi:calcium-binding protein, partial [Jhaorihella thermophila]